MRGVRNYAENGFTTPTSCGRRARSGTLVHNITSLPTEEGARDMNTGETTIRATNRVIRTPTHTRHRVRSFHEDRTTHAYIDQNSCCRMWPCTLEKPVLGTLHCQRVRDQVLLCWSSTVVSNRGQMRPCPTETKLGERD